jgi:hypothetical protein
MKRKSLFLTIAVLLGLRITATAQTPPSYVPTDGLVGWWPFNGNANDESGNGNNGTVNGATLTEDRFGNANAAYDYGAVNDYVFLDNLEANDSWSLSFWYETPSNNDFGLEYIFGFGNQWPSSWGLPGYGVSGVNQEIPCNNVEPTNFFITDAATECNSNNWLGTIVNSNWYNDVVVREGTNYSVYHQGNLMWSGTLNGIELNALKVGLRLDTWLDYSGKIDDIGIWNRALTQEEIIDLYNANLCFEYITVTDTLIINLGPTGFNPVSYSNTILMYPNPSNDQLTIDYGDYATLAGYTLKIFNSIGQEIHSANINQQQEVLPLGTWGGAGNYQVVIYNAQGVPVDTRTIVLQE